VRARWVLARVSVHSCLCERNDARAAASAAAGRAINTASRRRATRVLALRRGAHARSLHTHTSNTHRRRCNLMEMHEPTHMRLVPSAGLARVGRRCHLVVPHPQGGMGCAI
jgi:hypothetical protein